MRWHQRLAHNVTIVLNSFLVVFWEMCNLTPENWQPNEKVTGHKHAAAEKRGVGGIHKAPTQINHTTETRIYMQEDGAPGGALTGGALPPGLDP